MVHFGKNARGVALVMVLLLLMILVTLVGQFSYTVKVDGYSALNSSNDLRLRYALLSSVNYAIAQLQLDAKKAGKTQYDCELDEWAKPVWTVEKPGKFDDIITYYTISDENTKYNLLMLLQKEYPTNKEKKETEENTENSDDSSQKEDKNKKKDKEKPKPITPIQHFDRFVACLQKENKFVEPPKLREAIMSWMKDKRGKPDNAAGPFPTKIPLLSIKEIGLIKDIDRQFVSNIPGLNKGFRDIFTVWSDGKVNINTASSELLQSLNEKISFEMAESIIAHRKKMGLDGEIQTFQNINDLKKVEGFGADSSKLFQEIENIITVQSSYFTITATATLGNSTKKMTVVVLRKGLKIYKLFCDYE